MFQGIYNLDPNFLGYPKKYLCNRIIIRKVKIITEVLLDVLVKDKNILEIVAINVLDVTNILIMRSNSSDELIAAMKLSSLPRNLSICSNSV